MSHLLAETPDNAPFTRSFVPEIQRIFESVATRPRTTENRAMHEVTRILDEINEGNAAASDQLLPLVYDELRKLATARLRQERSDQTLQATALVHEAYMKLVDAEHSREWDNRGHFFAAAAEAMRRILLNRARDKKRLKRGGDRQRIQFDKIQLAMDTPSEELLALDEAVEQLIQEDPISGNLVKLRFFAGLTVKEVAQALGMSVRTANRQWAFARAWLHERMSESEKN